MTEPVRRVMGVSGVVFIAQDSARDGVFIGKDIAPRREWTAGLKGGVRRGVRVDAQRICRAAADRQPFSA